MTDPNIFREKAQLAIKNRIGEFFMSASTIIKTAGIVLVCVGIHFGLGALLPLIVFGAGLGFIFLP